MKLKRIFAGMAASAIAMTAVAASAVTVSAADATTGNAGISFQMDGTWNYRNVFNSEDQSAAFPAKTVAMQGGAYGLDTAVDCTDVAINGDGTYQVAIAASGTINAVNESAEEPNGFYLNEDKTLTREGSPWAMGVAYEPKASEDSSVELTQDQIEWVAGTASKKFNMLTITTDIPCTIEEDADGVEQAMVNGKVVTCTNVTANVGGTEYKLELAPQNTESEYLTFQVVNTYNKDYEDQPVITPPTEGMVTIDFTINGLSGDATSSSTADTSSKADTSSAAATTSSKAAGTTSSKAAGTTSASTSSTASDNKAAETGATAGIALAGIALAGAAIVVAKRK